MNCPLCGAELVKRYGKYGLFYGCSNFPDCRYTKEIEYSDKGYNDETLEYIESQTLRRWNPSMKKWGRDENGRY